MDNVEKLVDDIISQLQLHVVCQHKAFIRVFVAKQNLTPVMDRWLARASERYNVPFKDHEQLDDFLKMYLGFRVEIFQKPDPYPKPANHLLLTVGGLSCVIFDYEESK